MTDPRRQEIETFLEWVGDEPLLAAYRDLLIALTAAERERDEAQKAVRVRDAMMDDMANTNARLREVLKAVVSEIEVVSSLSLGTLAQARALLAGTADTQEPT